MSYYYERSVKMITRVKISGLDPQTIDRIDKKFGTRSWRFDVHETYAGIFDVDVAVECEVLYVTAKYAQYPIVLSMGDNTAQLKADEYNQIIGT